MSVFANELTRIIYDGTTHEYLNTNIKLYIGNNRVKHQGMFPVIIDGRTLVPLREVFEHESLGAEVIWFADEKKIVIVKEDKAIELWIGRKYAIVNGEQLELDVAPKLISVEGGEAYSKTMVPLRFIAESYGFDVQWNGSEQSIQLTHNSEIRNKEKENELIKLMVNSENPKYEDFSSVGGAYKETTLSRVLYYEYHDRYKIMTKSSMSSINTFVWDNKLVIDIDGGASIGNIETVIDVYRNDYVKNVRSSQYSLEPKVSRIVFDLIEGGAVPTTIELNEARTELDIVFGSDGLKGIEIGSDGESDYIDITGDFGDVNVFRLTNPERLVIDLENTLNPFGYKSYEELNSNSIEKVRIAQFNQTTTRIVAETSEKVIYRSIESEGVTTLLLNADIKSTPTQTTSSEYKELASLRMSDSSKSHKYEIEYNFLSKEAHIKFDGGIEEVLEVDKSIIKNWYDDKNEITFMSEHVYDLIIEQEGDTITIKGCRPRDIYETIVVIDPGGHGGVTAPGATYDGAMEKDLNLLIGNYIEELADDGGEIKYYFTRDDDKDISFADRCELANDLNADLFVSLHNNAMDIRKYPSQAAIRGLEVHISEGKEQSETEFELGEIFLSEASNIDGMVSRKIKVGGGLYVLNNTYMPSVLIEYAYMTNQEDIKFLSKESNLKRLAAMTLSCIEKFF